MNLIWYILLVSFVIVFKLVWDYFAKNEQKRVINHNRSAFIDSAIFLISAILFFEPIKSIGFFVMALGFRWLVFDIMFNLLNNWKWNNKGMTSSLDRFLTRMEKYNGKDGFLNSIINTIGKFDVIIKITAILIGYLITKL